ncbi:MAG: hypothetical protein WCT52_06035 [Candidatus Micrarchaeia archaeon]
MADEVQDEGLKKLKISKKAYVFDVRKKYSVNRNFLLKKKPETPAEDLKAQLEGFFNKKKKPAQAASSQGAGAPKQPKMSTFTAAITVVAVVLLFLLGGVAYVLWKVNVPPSGTSEAPREASFIGKLSIFVREADLLTSTTNDRIQRSAYALLEYSTERVMSMNFTLKAYSRRPTTQVFLLDYARDSADNYPVFRKRLLDGLKEKQIPVAEIGVEKLAGLPAGAIVVVPTGYLPKEFIGMDSPFDYRSLLARGSNIIYIGLEMTRVMDRSGSTISANPTELVFKQAKLQSTENFRLFDGQYVVSAKPRGDMSSSQPLYNSVSVVCHGNGCMMFLPQNLDGGWRGDEQYSPGEVAANDVLRMITDEKWLPVLSTVTANPPISEGGAKTLTLLTPPFPNSVIYAELITEATDLQGMKGRMLDVFKVVKSTNGELQPRESYAVPYYLSGQLTRLNMDLSEPDPTPVKLFVRVYKDGTVLQDEELELGLTVPDKQKSKDIQMDTGPGDYMIKVTDKNGKPYAATAITVINPTVSINGSPNWEKGMFTFYVTANGVSMTPRAISVSMDNKSEKRYSPTTYVYSNGKPYIYYEYPGQIKPGIHNFTFTSGSWVSTVPLEFRAQKYMWDNPLVVFLAIVSVLIFGVAQVLRRPEVLKYGLDIPDFPPQSTLKIPVKSETILQIFNDVNADFSWQWMPLRLEELKNGFRRLTYNGKPILIGDFNLERLLYKLRDEGKIREELGYWGLVDWEKQSKHTIRYLTIYRIMRNVFVNNAVKFSKLDSIAECDVKAIAGKDEKYFHVMEGEPERIIHRALATAKKGTTIIVFGTDEEKDAFRSTLVSTSKLAIAVKMEMHNNNIMLMPVKNAISAYLKSITA